jgi:hypothetical protein
MCKKLRGGYRTTLCLETRSLHITNIALSDDRMIVKPEASTRCVKFKYIRDDPSYAREKPYRLHKITPIKGVPLTNVSFHSCEARNLVDMRDDMHSLDLDHDSFKFMYHPSKVKLDDSVDAIREFCQESIDMLKSQVKADRVICYEILVSYR